MPGVFGHTTHLPGASIAFGPCSIKPLPHYQHPPKVSGLFRLSGKLLAPYGCLVHAKCCLCTGQISGSGPINQALPFQNRPGAFFLSASFSFYFGSGLPKCFNFSFYFGSGLPKCFKFPSRFGVTEALRFAKPACTHHSILGLLDQLISAGVLPSCTHQGILGLLNEWACACRRIPMCQAIFVHCAIFIFSLLCLSELLLFFSGPFHANQHFLILICIAFPPASLQHRIIGLTQFSPSDGSCL